MEHGRSGSCLISVDSRTQATSSPNSLQRMPILAYTLRTAHRSPSTWVLILLSLLVTWAGAALGVLTLDDSGGRIRDLAISTGELGACLLLLSALSREGASLDDDPWPDAALEASRPGAWGVLWGRVTGAVLLSTTPLAACVTLVAVLYNHTSGVADRSVYSAIICPIAAILAELLCLSMWVGVLGAFLAGSASTLAGMLLLGASRFDLGSVLNGLLPVSAARYEASAARLGSLAVELLATLGLALLTLALRRRSRAT